MLSTIHNQRFLIVRALAAAWQKMQPLFTLVCFMYVERHGVHK